LNLLNAEYLEHVTRSPTKIGSQIGDVYNLLSGKFFGRIVGLSPHEIVIKMGYTDFPQNHFSTLRFLLEELPGKGCKLTIKQSEIPSSSVKTVEGFWNQFLLEFQSEVDEEEM